MFYEENAAAKSPELTVMKAKNGQKLRCKPHSCPTKLDVEKINKVYQCKNADHDSTLSNAFDHFQDKNQSQKQNCTSLKWKYFDLIQKETDNPVVFKQVRGERVFVCRARTSNGKYALGIFYKYGCRGAPMSPFFWNFIQFDVLTNPNNVQIDWISANSPPKNAVLVTNRSKNPFYVIKCMSDRSSGHCLDIKYLIC